MIKSEWQGKTVLVTGASYGIGEAFAQQLAEAGAHLILTARSRDRLETLASALRKRHPVHISIVVADLADPTGPQTIHREVQRAGLQVDLLINNAGFGLVGDFAQAPLDRQMEMIRVNVSALVELTHLFLQEMLQRRSGAIINVASTASFQAVPYFSIYAATKAFVLSFSEALHLECESANVRVLALCPGRTETHFQSVAGTGKRSSAGGMQTAAEVALVGLEALAQGRSHVVSGTNNRIMVQLERVLPRSVITRAAGRLYQQFSSQAQGKPATITLRNNK